MKGETVGHDRERGWIGLETGSDGGNEVKWRGGNGVERRRTGLDGGNTIGPGWERGWMGRTRPGTRSDGGKWGRIRPGTRSDKGNAIGRGRTRPGTGLDRAGNGVERGRM